MATEKRTFGVSGELDPSTFVDRRSEDNGVSENKERRQFSDAREQLSPEASELGKAIDQYKLLNRRRYVTYEEMLTIIKSIGYSK